MISLGRHKHGLMYNSQTNSDDAHLSVHIGPTVHSYYCMQGQMYIYQVTARFSKGRYPALFTSRKSVTLNVQPRSLITSANIRSMTIEGAITA